MAAVDEDGVSMGGARRTADSARVGDAPAGGCRSACGGSPRAIADPRAVLVLQRTAGNTAVGAGVAVGGGFLPATDSGPNPVRVAASGDGGLPTRIPAAAIKEIRTRLSDGKIQQAAIEQLGRAWSLAEDVVVQVPDEDA